MAAARILNECGLNASVEETVETARGQVAVDVVATERVHGRQTFIFCECKRWKRSIPQSVVHSFRTVVQDAGANVGYLISASPYQPGAKAAAELTNIRLLTWEEFQAEFQEQWFRTFLLAEVVRRIDPLFSYTEPINSTVFRAWDAASDEQQASFSALRSKYGDFGMTMLAFTPYHPFMKEIPPLPLTRVRSVWEGTNSVFPQHFFEATSYREWLDECLAFGEQALAELRAALPAAPL